MTIKGFSKVFDADEEISIKKLESQTMAIDGPVEVFRTALAQVKLTNPAGESTQHITSCLFNMLTCLANNIDSIWNWDAKEANVDKKAENERRAELQTQHRQEIKEMESELIELEETISGMKIEKVKQVAPDILEKIKAKRELLHRKKISHPESSHISRFYRDVKFMIDQLGIKSSIAPTGVEAEQQCAYLCNLGMADAVMSTDPDTLLCGAPVLYKKISGKTGKYNKYTLENCLKQHKLSMTQFIEVGVALGTDFAPKVAGVGVATVIKKLKDDLIDFDEEQEYAIKRFKTKLTYKPVITQTKMTKTSLDTLKKWLIKEQGFNEETWTKRFEFLYARLDTNKEDKQKKTKK